MTRLRIGLALASVFATSFALAQTDPHQDPRQDPRHSGYHDMGPELRRMQDDDTANPAMLFVQSGEALWQEKAGSAQKSCADCHHDAAESMKGVAARYPAIPPGADKPVDLEGRINLCRTERQQAPALAPESPELLGLAAYVALQSRGQPIAPPADPRLAALRSEGARIYQSRQGQLNLSCANCHNDNAGKKLAGAPIPQGHATGYPIYRLEWQTLGSLKRRLRNCLVGMRAEAWEWGDPQYVALELYLMDRARGMAMDAPAVRP
jgi:L-cysteine S-thiosulfotransferase